MQANRDFKKGRSSGETHLFIRKTINSNCNILKHDEFRIWCKIDKGIVQNDNKDLYIPPTNSRLFLSGKSFNFDQLKLNCYQKLLNMKVGEGAHHFDARHKCEDWGCM